MAAKITAPKVTEPTDPVHDGAPPVSAADLKAFVEASTISGIDHTNMKPANVDGAPNVPSLRTLGTGANQACAGNDPRLSDARPANAILHDTSTATPIATGTPIVGRPLFFDGYRFTAGTPNRNIPGTCTSVTINGTTTVTGVGTQFTKELAAGYEIEIAGERRVVESVSSDTELTVTSAFGGSSTETAFTYAAPIRERPFNRVLSVNTDYSATIENIGDLLLVSTSEDCMITLPPAISFPSGCTIAVKKASNNTNAVTILPTGSDTVEGASSLVLSASQSCVLLVSNGQDAWYVGAKFYGAKLLLQRVSTTMNTEQGVGDSWTPILSVIIKPTTLESRLLVMSHFTFTGSPSLSNSTATCPEIEYGVFSNGVMVEKYAGTAGLNVATVQNGALVHAGCGIAHSSVFMSYVPATTAELTVQVKARATTENGVTVGENASLQVLEMEA